MNMDQSGLTSPEDFKTAFSGCNYLLPEQAATILFLAGKLEKPILVEGPAGVGKTDLARVLSTVLGCKLIRLQCYEGLDEGKALYEWQYGKQLLYSQILKDKISEILEGKPNLSEAMERVFRFDDVFFSERFLQPRPLLAAISAREPVVLLIDEVDKSDSEFEAFLLEVLSDYSVSIPEIGTICANTIPRVILTSNNNREMSDALKRRCLHLFIDFPGPEAELEIIRLKNPAVGETLGRHVVDIVNRIRNLPLKKAPSISETLDWAAALVSLSVDSMSEEAFNRTLGALLKYENDLGLARDLLPELKKEMIVK